MNLTCFSNQSRCDSLPVPAAAAIWLSKSGVWFYLEFLLPLPVSLRLLLDVGLDSYYSGLFAPIELDLSYWLMILGLLNKLFVWVNPKSFCDRPPLARIKSLSLCGGDLLTELSRVLAIGFWLGVFLSFVLTGGTYVELPKIGWDLVLVKKRLRGPIGLGCAGVDSVLGVFF